MYYTLGVNTTYSLVCVVHTTVCVCVPVHKELASCFLCRVSLVAVEDSPCKQPHSVCVCTIRKSVDDGCVVQGSVLHASLIQAGASFLWYDQRPVLSATNRQILFVFFSEMKGGFVWMFSSSFLRVSFLSKPKVSFLYQKNGKTQSSLIVEHWCVKKKHQASCACMLKQRWSLLKAFSSSQRVGGLMCEI